MSRRGAYYDMVVRQMESDSFQPIEVSSTSISTNGIQPKSELPQLIQNNSKENVQVNNTSLHMPL